MIKFKADPAGKKIFVMLGDVNLMGKRIRHRLRRSLAISGSEINRETVRLIQSPPKTGRLYRFKGGLHQASAPGEAPANKTGNLSRTNYYKVQSAQELEVGETAEYAGYLEDGTTKMRPRPHIIKAIDNMERNIKRRLDKAILKALP